MKHFEVYPSERTAFADRVSKQTVYKLTSYKGHSEHAYFTDDSWYENDKRMLFLSDRENVRNIFSIEIESGEISRLTDFKAGEPDVHCPMAVNQALNETYYQKADSVFALNLETLEARPIYQVPAGFNFGGARPTGDGKAVVAGLSEDLSSTIKSNLTAGYIGFREIHEAKPDCRIIKINLSDNSADEIWREKCWVGHVNPSPSVGNIITFCHEGPWDLVDHRIWVLDLDTGKAAKFRERRVANEKIGHEYWFEDGIHIGYQVHTPDKNAPKDAPDGAVSYFGFAPYDLQSAAVEAEALRVPGPDHVHSVDFNFIVSDTGKSIKGYKFNGKTFDGPRVITMHDGSFDWGAHHPHPAVTRDGKNIVYNSTASGYCQIYMTAIPEDFDALPPVIKK